MSRKISFLLVLFFAVLGTLARGENPVFSEDVLRLAALIDQSSYLEVLDEGPTLLERFQAALPEGSVDEAKVLDFMVHACYRSRQVMNPEAIVWGERAIVLKEQLLGEDSPELANSLMHLGNLYSRRYEGEESLPYFDRAVAILERCGEEHDSKRAIILSSQGVAYRSTGNNKKAMELYGQALAIQERVLGPDHPQVASILNNQAVVLSEWGDYSASEMLHRRAMAIREKHLGPDHEWVGESANNLANQLGYLGKYEEALSAQERAVEIFAAKLGTNHPRYWTVLLNLGMTYADMGDHNGAVTILLQVAEGLEELYGETNPNVCYPLDGLGHSYHLLGQSALALEYFTRSLTIGEAYYGVGSLETADTIGQMGQCLMALGRQDEAVERLSGSVEAYRNSLEEPNAQLCDPLNRLAEAYLKNGDFPEALSQAEQSRDLGQRDLGEDHPLLAMSSLLMGQAYVGLGRKDEAMAAALLAEEVSRRHLNQTMPVLSEHRALHYAASRVDGLDLALSLLEDGDSGPKVAQVWDALIRSRSGVLEQYVARNKWLSRDSDTMSAALQDSSLALRERLANLTLRGPGWEEVSVYQRLLDETHAELVALERKLSLHTVSFGRERTSEERGLDEVAKALPEHSALLAYCRGTGPDGPSTYNAFLLAGVDESPRFFRLATAEELDSAVEAWRDQATLGVRRVEPVSSGVSVDGGQRGFVKVHQDPETRLQDYFSVGERLRQLVWDRPAVHLDQVEMIFLVADGSLHLVSFPSLPVSPDSFLLEQRWLFHNLMAEKALIEGTRDSAPEKKLLAVGGARYDQETAKGDPGTSRSADGALGFGSLDFKDLPQATQEVHSIQQIWAHEGRETALLIGAEATEANTKAQMPGAEVIHLATHGFFLPGQRSATESQVWNNPLARSGLALAGANHWQAAASGSNDGILTAEEIAALDLTGVRWAVLSACDTGLGELAVRGEGVMGLRRAFALAGAGTVIMSLWSVDDEAARLWMESLYTARWENQASTAEAVRQASLELLAGRRAAGLSAHPYYWAGFMAAGRWQ